MNRRGFLKLIGVFASLPAIPAHKIASATMYGGPISLFECDPLEQGIYTFSAMCEHGIYVCGVTAKGGETYFQIEANYPLHDMVLSKEGVSIPAFGHIDFTKPLPSGASRGKDLIKT